MDGKTDAELRASAEKAIRHMEATRASDWEHLRRNLREAASRMEDMADIIEKDRSYDPVHMLRASAERFRLAADLKS